MEDRFKTQDRFKFRMYDTNINKMYMPNDFGMVESIYECIKQQINWDLDVDYDIKFNHLEDGRFFMQCTGLKDKNGKLIYEGDILYENMINTVFPKGKYWIVEWNNNTAQFFIELINKTGNSLTDTWHLARHSYDYEVIGNIYKNPELLED